MVVSQISGKYGAARVGLAAPCVRLFADGDVRGFLFKPSRTERFPAMGAGP